MLISCSSFVVNRIHVFGSTLHLFAFVPDGQLCSINSALRVDPIELTLPQPMALTKRLGFFETHRSLQERHGKCSLGWRRLWILPVWVYFHKPGQCDRRERRYLRRCEWIKTRVHNLGPFLLVRWAQEGVLSLVEWRCQERQRCFFLGACWRFWLRRHTIHCRC